MKQVVAAAAAAAICAVLSSSAFAGVVITETESTVSGAPQKSTERTLMIQGNKEKMVTPQYQVITDLDKGVMYMVNPADKSYSELPFPPQGPMAHATGMRPTSFKKTGKTRTVAGYKCEEYQGEGKFMMGDYTVISCISTDAPGAKEFAGFEKQMQNKLKGSAFAMPSNLPDGVPLAQDMTTKMSAMNLPANLPPETAAKLKEQLANRPPVVSKTEVTKVATQKLSDDTFAIPTGYTKREHTMAHGAMSGGNSHGGGEGGAGGPGGAGGASGAGGAGASANPHSGE